MRFPYTTLILSSMCAFFSLCTAKRTLINITLIDSSRSVFYENIAGEYSVLLKEADISHLLAIKKNGTYVRTMSIYGTPIERAEGKWALDDSLLILEQNTTAVLGRYQRSETVEYSVKRLQSVYNLYNVLTAGIYVKLPEGGDENNYLLFKRIDNQ